MCARVLYGLSLSFDLAMVIYTVQDANECDRGQPALAPNNPYPKQMKQAILAFQHLLASGYHQSNVCLPST